VFGSLVSRGRSANSVYMFVQLYVRVIASETQEDDESADVARKVRRILPGSIDATIKTLQCNGLTRGMIEAKDGGAPYLFLTDGDTNLTEGSGFNMVLVKDNVLYTP
jgi:branched-subunit amino acid aminotransferase/4-amino-4-deoxychorismate lyase